MINYFTIVDTPISLHIYFRAASLPLVKLDSAVSSKEEISLSCSILLSLQARRGRNYEYLVNFDMYKWNLLRQIKGTGEEEKFIDVRRAFYPRQYYRVKETE